MIEHQSNRSSRNNMPDEAVIRLYWLGTDLPERKGFDCDDEFLDPGICFACGFEWPLERSHIVARCEGGSDDASNLHMLCRICHKESEFLRGEVYWDWFWKRTIYDRLASGAMRGGLNVFSFMAATAAAYRGEGPASIVTPFGVVDPFDPATWPKSQLFEPRPHRGPRKRPSSPPDGPASA